VALHRRQRRRQHAPVHEPVEAAAGGRHGSRRSDAVQHRQHVRRNTAGAEAGVNFRQPGIDFCLAGVRRIGSGEFSLKRGLLGIQVGLFSHQGSEFRVLRWR
jgi:hypothetical protein